MTVRMIKKSWWVDLTFNYIRHRERSPENSKTGAQAYEAVLRQKLARGESIDRIVLSAQQEQTFGQFTRRWFDEYVVVNNKSSEQRTKKYILSASLVPFFGKMPVKQITSRHIEQYKAHLTKEGVTKKTVNNRLTVFNKCMSMAYEWMDLKGAPPKVVWLKSPPPNTDYLSPDECALLLAHSEGVAHELILTALRTGMRQGELRGLQWSSIDWQNRSITVQHSLCDYTQELESPKSNRKRHVHMTADLYEMLLKRKKSTGYVFLGTNGKPFDHHRIAYPLTAVCKKAGLRHFGWHTLRHTFASHLAAKGAPLNAVQALLGHSTIATTMRYAHLAPSTLRAVVDMLDPNGVLSVDFGQPMGNQWLEAHRYETVQKAPVPENLVIS